MSKYDICIIGGGASGMTAAITAKQQNQDLKVVILEKKEELGKKICATGNGRCNLMNTECEFVPPILAFFDSVGIVTRAEAEGRVYPYAGEASQVVEAFVQQINTLGVEVICNETVEAVEKTADGFAVTAASGNKYETAKLIIACGGKAAPQFGTTGDGYAWVRSLGHTVTKLSPALAPIELADYEGLKGVRSKGSVTLIKNDQLVKREDGEIQFTETGISGIAVFNLSRYIRYEEDETPEEGISKYAVAIDFMPEIEETMAVEFLKHRCTYKGFTLVDALRTLVDTKVAEMLVKKADIALDKLAADATEEEISRLAGKMKICQLPVAGVGGWKTAQCTAGGVPVREVTLATMHSNKVDGLYLIGEILDYDGPCGGYNLQNAWETGIKAGMDASK